MSPDFQTMFVPTHPLADIVIRGTIIYLGIFILMRIILNRRSQGVSTPDVLLTVLIAGAAQNGLAHEYRSVTEGLVLVLTLLLWDVALDWLVYRVPAFERFTRQPPLPLIENGRVNRRNMRQELMSMGELEGLLREQGIEDVGSVSHAYLEPTGTLSVLGRKQE
jgi:uncharacterized membrane protein YcaP (DUF421 family)